MGGPDSTEQAGARMSSWMGKWGWSNPPKHKHESKALDKRIAQRRADTAARAAKLRDKAATARAQLATTLAAMQGVGAPPATPAAESRTAAEWLAEAGAALDRAETLYGAPAAGPDAEDPNPIDG